VLFLILRRIEERRNFAPDDLPHRVPWQRRADSDFLWNLKVGQPRMAKYLKLGRIGYTLSGIAAQTSSPYFASGTPNTDPSVTAGFTSRVCPISMG